MPEIPLFIIRTAAGQRLIHSETLNKLIDAEQALKTVGNDLAAVLDDEEPTREALGERNFLSLRRIWSTLPQSAAMLREILDEYAERVSP